VQYNNQQIQLGNYVHVKDALVKICNQKHAKKMSGYAGIRQASTQSKSLINASCFKVLQTKENNTQEISLIYTELSSISSTSFFSASSLKAEAKLSSLASLWMALAAATDADLHYVNRIRMNK